MAKKNTPAAGTPATLALSSRGIPFTPHPYEHHAGTAGYGIEAAEALGVDPDRVFKTLLADVDGTLVVGVVPVSAQLDLKALAAAAGGKRASMADPGVAERKTGYVVGGISPIGQKVRLVTVVDESADLFPTIFVSGGRRGFDIELTPAGLLDAAGGRLAAIARR